MTRIGVIALARPTFDVEYAEEVAAAAFEALNDVDPNWVGNRALLFDADSTREAIAQISDSSIDAVVVLQVTFTDASMTQALANEMAIPVVFWAFPEDRTGGRLRLNSLCGINLAAYTLRRDGHTARFMYRRSDDPAAADELRSLLAAAELSRSPYVTAPSSTEPSAAAATASAVDAALAGLRTGVIGDYPHGFDPCAYDAAEVAALTGVTVQRLELGDLFAAADAAPAGEVEDTRRRAAEALGPLDDLDQESLGKSLRLYHGMRRLATDNGWAALATRCWPECFTEYGGAACAPQAMLTDDGIPGGCEADVYGNLTSLILRELSGEPPFVADLVDIDFTDDTAVFWHCGVAPLHMADPSVIAGPTVHSNRRKPLLHEFSLKPGRVTIARLSQSAGSPRLVIGGGEMVRAPLAFSGTAGVCRLDRPAREVLATIMAEGLEHHYGLTYGSHGAGLRALARLWKIPVVDLT